jgi:hypothetical protein
VVVWCAFVCGAMTQARAFSRHAYLVPKASSLHCVHSSLIMRGGAIPVEVGIPVSVGLANQMVHDGFISLAASVGAVLFIKSCSYVTTSFVLLYPLIMRCHRWFTGA